MDGFIGLKIAAENRLKITFDDVKTDQQKITDALLQGGVAVPGKPEPVAETPFSYR